MSWSPSPHQGCVRNTKTCLPWWRKFSSHCLLTHINLLTNNWLKVFETARPAVFIPSSPLHLTTGKDDFKLFLRWLNTSKHTVLRSYFKLKRLLSLFSSQKTVCFLPNKPYSEDLSASFFYSLCSQLVSWFLLVREEGKEKTEKGGAGNRIRQGPPLSSQSSPSCPSSNWLLYNTIQLYWVNNTFIPEVCIYLLVCFFVKHYLR